jgi:hypothetical protein
MELTTLKIRTLKIRPLKVYVNKICRPDHAFNKPGMLHLQPAKIAKFYLTPLKNPIKEKMVYGAKRNIHQFTIVK